MLFGSFKPAQPPIAVDFGTSALKVMQTQPAADGKPETLLALAATPTPPELLEKPAKRLEFQSKALSEILRGGPFKGKRAVCAVSASHTIVQHMQLVRENAKSLSAQVGDEVRTITSREPSSFILRHTEICEVTRSGTKRAEVICIAMPREAVIAHMKALDACRLEAVGIHAEHTALIKAVEKLAGSASSSPTCFIDIGSNTTRVGVTLNGALRQAKVIPMGARNLYQSTAASAEPQAKGQPVDSARRALRAQLQALEAESAAVATLEQPAREQAGAIIPGAIESLSDEIAQCIRYYQALFPEQKVERAIFAGGEATKLDVCKKIARALAVSSQIADPIGSLERSPTLNTDAVDCIPSPAWAVPLGLCNLPIEA